jgi:hypothetical protein
MIKFFTHWLTAIAHAFALMACTPSPPESYTQEISVASITDSNLAPTVKADELASAAEDLMTAHGFDEANKTASLALKEDPKHLKAGLIKALTDVVLILRGLQIRLDPLMQKDKANYPLLVKSFSEGFQRLKMPFLEKLMVDGVPDITSETELLDYIDKVMGTLERLVLFTNEHRTEEVTLKAYPIFSNLLNSRYVKTCELKTNAKGDFEIACPDKSTRFQVMLNPADFEEIKLIATTYLFLLTYLGSYDISGIIEADIDRRAHPELPFQSFIETLLKNKNFGTLRKTARLSNLRTISSDILGSLHWFSSHLSFACPMGQADPSYRQGMLFFDALCVDPSFMSFFSEIIDHVSGKPIVKILNNNGQPVSGQLDYLKFADHPLTDLRQLGHVTFNNCRDILNIGEPSMGGIFPNKDANFLLPLLQPRCDR